MAIVAETAEYFGTTNEFNGFKIDNIGVDFFNILNSGVSLVFYPFAGSLADNFGLRVMSWSAFGIFFSCWLYFIAGTNYPIVLLSLVIMNVSGVLNAVCLLKISNKWFSQKERTVAVAIGSFFAVFGSGFALLIGPAFKSGEDNVNLGLKSCEFSFRDSFNGTLVGFSCSEEAIESFCCSGEVDFQAMNLFVGLLGTFVLVLSVASVKNKPTVMPSVSAAVKEGTPFLKGFKLMFKHRNYNQLCLADFISSGPPIVVFLTIDRIFPASVSEYSTTAAAIGLFFAIPLAIAFTYFLDKKKQYFKYSAGAYTVGLVLFVLVTIFVFIEGAVTDIVVLVLGSAAPLTYILWTISVYGLKLEYVFDRTHSLEGNIVAIDRTIINLSSVLFVAAIPPERYKGSLMSGRQFTFVIGTCFMILGTVLVYSIKDYDKYKRKAFELEHHNNNNKTKESVEEQPQEEPKTEELIENKASETIQIS